MPEEIDAVISDLLDHGAVDPTRRRSGTYERASRLASGVLALDYGDEGHAFRVTVEQVPRRRWAPETPVVVGHVDGVDVALVGIVVDNFVHIHLTAVETDERDRISAAHLATFEAWAAAPKEERGDPPNDPAQRLVHLAVTVTDDLDTHYVSEGGHFGGTGTEWDAVMRFAPPAPSTAPELRIGFTAPPGATVTVLAPLA